MKTVYLVALQFKVNFHDADDGDCYAGDGQRILRVYSSEDAAGQLIPEWNPVIAAAEKETTMFPIQGHNLRIKKEFGLTLDEVSDGYGFRLECAGYGITGN